MKSTATGRAITIVSAVLAGLLGVGVLRAWFTSGRETGVTVRVPQMDDPTGQEARDAEERANRTVLFIVHHPTGPSAAIYETFDGRPSDLSGQWPRFRGQNFDGICVEDVKLAHAFPAGGPRKVWELAVGLGYSGPVVHKGRVFLLDYDEPYKAEILRCFSLADGREIWRAGYNIDIDNNHGMTRTVPAVTDRYVAAFGSYCSVMCLETDTGRIKWGLDLTKEYGAKIPMWHAGQCPMIDNGLVIVAPGSDRALMIAVDCETGKVTWETPNPMRWRQSHSSIRPMTVAGVKMYVYAAVGGVAGVAADGERAGELLWSTPDWSTSVVMPSPVPVGGDRIFVTSGYDGGSALIRITADGGRFGTETIYNYRGKRLAPECFSCYQQTPVFYGGRLFGIQSNSAKQSSMEFVCVDPDEPGGKIVWSSGKDVSFTARKKNEAWGPWILADGKFYVFGDSGLMAVFKADTGKCVLLGTTQLWEDGHECWGPPAIAGGLLLMRDVSRLACFDIRGEGL